MADDEGMKVTGTFTHTGGFSKIWERTSALRVVRRLGPYGPIDRLQQGWCCAQDGEIEWRDVDVVDRDGNPMESR